MVSTDSGDLPVDEVVVCGGLQSAGLAMMAGDDPDPAIIPSAASSTASRRRATTW